jgi:hypothetical protein
MLRASFSLSNITHTLRVEERESSERLVCFVYDEELKMVNDDEIVLNLDV